MSRYQAHRPADRIEDAAPFDSTHSQGDRQGDRQIDAGQDKKEVADERQYRREQQRSDDHTDIAHHPLAHIGDSDLPLSLSFRIDHDIGIDDSQQDRRDDEGEKYGGGEPSHLVEERRCHRRIVFGVIAHITEAAHIEHIGQDHAGDDSQHCYERPGNNEHRTSKRAEVQPDEVEGECDKRTEVPRPAQVKALCLLH